MAARMVYSGSNPNGRKAVVHYHSEYKEFVVQFTREYQHLHLCDYYTDNYEDAVAAAQAHLEGRYT